MTRKTSNSDKEINRSCVACGESIKDIARVCPHCRSPQKPQPWQVLATFLKWTAGAVTIAALITYCVNLRGNYSDWREKRRHVNELIKAAERLKGFETYSMAWEMYDQALVLSPSSRLARDGQIELAMIWLKDFTVGLDFDHEETPYELISALSRGLGSNDRDKEASILSHIGLAYELIGAKKWNAIIEKTYRQALEIAPDNPFANTLFGRWIVKDSSDYSEGKRYFALALERGVEKEWIRREQLVCLLTLIRNSFSSTKPENKGYSKELLNVLNGMRVAKEPAPQPHLSSDLVSVLYGSNNSPSRMENLISMASPEEHLQTLRWLISTMDLQSPHYSNVWKQIDFAKARLTEEIGNTKTAFDLYSELAKETLVPELRSQVDERMNKILKEINN